MRTDFLGRTEARNISFFPANCQVSVLPALKAVHNTMTGKPPSPKQDWTFRNRHFHYFIFLDDLRITDDWTLEGQPQEHANLKLTMYATGTHLARVSTILCRTVKASPIRAYLATAAKFLGRFRPIDPSFVTSGDKKLAPAISMVIAEQER